MYYIAVNSAIVHHDQVEIHQIRLCESVEATIKVSFYTAELHLESAVHLREIQLFFIEL